MSLSLIKTCDSVSLFGSACQGVCWLCVLNKWLASAVRIIALSARTKAVCPAPTRLLLLNDSIPLIQTKILAVNRMRIVHMFHAVYLYIYMYFIACIIYPKLCAWSDHSLAFQS